MLGKLLGTDVDPVSANEAGNWIGDFDVESELDFEGLSLTEVVAVTHEADTDVYNAQTIDDCMYNPIQSP